MSIGIFYGAASVLYDIQAAYVVGAFKFSARPNHRETAKYLLMALKRPTLSHFLIIAGPSMWVVSR
jgi:hypothetical protein